LKYSIDTSALITAWRFHYPPVRFPSIWRSLEGLIRSGDLRASPMVLAELKRGEDDLYEWACRQTDLFVVPDDEEQELMRAIVPGLVKPGEDRINADPFVVALAMRHGLAVVTQEKAKGPGGQPTIPNVCAARGIRCFDILGLFEDCGWTF
jgi:predicted nucleic acid-binding protein